jgi:hypothetical protein
MRIRETLPRLYGSANFAAMTQAFDAAWAVLRAHETDDVTAIERRAASTLIESGKAASRQAPG